MSRTKRLFEILQILRRHRFPIKAETIADTLQVSVRTIYRDIATLQSQGAHIEGEAGIGYILQPGFTLPPLMFSEEELEALILGARWVTRHADQSLANAAENAKAKIAAVLPQQLRLHFDNVGLLVGPNERVKVEDDLVKLIRQSISCENKIKMIYHDVKEENTQRTIWPFALAYFNETQIVVAWCELRQAFRHFRLDRIKNITLLKEIYPRKKAVLLKEWRLIHNIPMQ